MKTFSATCKITNEVSISFTFVFQAYRKAKKTGGYMEYLKVIRSVNGTRPSVAIKGLPYGDVGVAKGLEMMKASGWVVAA